MPPFSAPLLVVLTGPESSGKTTLCQLLAAEYGTTWVPEQARGYLTARGGAYVEEDLVQIAKQQLRVQAVRARRAKGYLFADTGMLVLKIWSLVRYGRVAPFIETALHERPPAACILCRPDMPWEPDPLREHPSEREGLYELYRAYLMELHTPFVEVSGQPQERVAQVRRFLEGLFEGEKRSE